MIVLHLKALWRPPRDFLCLPFFQLRRGDRFEIRSADGEIPPFAFVGTCFTFESPLATDEQGGEPRGAERGDKPVVWAVFIRIRTDALRTGLRRGAVPSPKPNSNRCRQFFRRTDKSF